MASSYPRLLRRLDLQLCPISSSLSFPRLLLELFSAYVSAERRPIGTITATYTTKAAACRLRWPLLCFRRLPHPSRVDSANKQGFRWRDFHEPKVGFEKQHQQQAKFRSRTGETPGPLSLHRGINYKHRRDFQLLFAALQVGGRGCASPCDCSARRLPAQSDHRHTSSNDNAMHCFVLFFLRCEKLSAGDARLCSGCC